MANFCFVSLHVELNVSMQGVTINMHLAPYSVSDEIAVDDGHVITVQNCKEQRSFMVAKITAAEIFQGSAEYKLKKSLDGKNYGNIDFQMQLPKKQHEELLDLIKRGNKPSGMLSLVDLQYHPNTNLWNAELEPTSSISDFRFDFYMGNNEDA